jgi:hypothetical protein
MHGKSGIRLNLKNFEALTMQIHQQGQCLDAPVRLWILVAGNRGGKHPVVSWQDKVLIYLQPIPVWSLLPCENII